MRYLLRGSRSRSCAGALGQPATAEDEGPPVPVQNASYHQPVFTNDRVMVLNVYIPPGRSLELPHPFARPDRRARRGGRPDRAGDGRTGDRAAPRHQGQRQLFRRLPAHVTHRGSNVGETPFHNIVVALTKPGPEGLTAGARDVPGYTQVVDSDRVRAWRLILEPGQSVAAITQKSPGMRIVVDGGEIVESAPGARDRARAFKLGDFFWQDGGETRAIRNVGTTRVELVEFELK